MWLWSEEVTVKTQSQQAKVNTHRRPGKASNGDSDYQKATALDSVTWHAFMQLRDALL